MWGSRRLARRSMGATREAATSSWGRHRPHGSLLSWAAIAAGTVQVRVDRDLSVMAKSQSKAGGPTRGRRRVRKIGMGSGKYLLARRDARKGVTISKSEIKDDAKA